MSSVEPGELAALLPSSADKTGASSQVIQTPKGAGKIEGLGESFSAQLSTGIATFRVPIRLPPARGAVALDLALSYSSANGWGVAGIGWDIGVPYIARQTDRGIPRYTDTPNSDFDYDQDRFVFNGGQELVPICTVGSNLTCEGKLDTEEMPPWSEGSQYFRPRVEGSFLRFFWSANHETWRVQDKSGVTMEFGVPLDGSHAADGIEADLAPGPLRIYRWNLVRQYDTEGSANPTSSSTLPAPLNLVRYRYLKVGPASYLSDIYDTTPLSELVTQDETRYAHHARLIYEERPDPVTSYKSGWEIRRTKRLARIDVTSKTFAYGDGRNRSLVRRYHLGYTPGVDVSLLESIEVEGRCGDNEDAGSDAPLENQNGDLIPTGCARLPPMRFQYTPYQAFDGQVRSMAESPDHSVDDALVDFFDINADALPDVLITAPGRYGSGHAVFFNSHSGLADSFSAASSMRVQGILGATANSIRLSNPNVMPLDADGDGIIDLLHMPVHRRYAIYSPRGSGFQFDWVGRQVQTSDGLNSRIDFGRDALSTRVLDVNFDGLIDVVRTTGTEIQTFLALARLPGGNGQFGNGELTGPSSARLSAEPIRSCLPWRGKAVSFDDPEIQLGDMNGDGIQDIVRIRRGEIRYWPGRGNGSWGTGPRAHCSGLGFSQGNDVKMAESPFFSNLSGVRLDDVDGDGLDDLVQVRNDSVDIWVNAYGEGWRSEYTIDGTPPNPSFTNRIRLVDINGSGTRDIVWASAGKYQYIDLLAGTRPYLLTRIENGIGKSTDIEYGTSTEEMLAAKRAGESFETVMPIVNHIVKRVTDTDNLTVAGAGPGRYVTEYAYRNPVWDGRQREFRGFRSAVTRKIGDGNSPTDLTSTTFLLGECESSDPTAEVCDPAEDNVREALKGLPVLTERFSEAGVYLNTQATFYRLRPLYTGRDGRVVQYAFASRTQSTLYDTFGAIITGPFTGTLTTAASVFIESAQPWPAGSVPLYEPSSGVPYKSITVPLRAQSGYAVTESSSVMDRFGNKTAGISKGCVAGSACPTSAAIGIEADEEITTITNPGRPPGDETGWLFRTMSSYVKGSVRTEERKKTRISYDTKGRSTKVEAFLSGTLPLVRAHKTAGQATAPEPATKSADNVWILVSSKTYDQFGNVQTVVTPNGRCQRIEYDRELSAGTPANPQGFAQLPVRETVYTQGNVTEPCSGAALVTAATYDRGLQLVKTTTDAAGRQTAATYDGFGRITRLLRPNPYAVNATASVRLIYDIGSQARPYSLVTTMVQDSPDTATTTEPSPYLTTWTVVDGLGRTRVVTTEADTMTGFDPEPYIRSEISVFDAKGAVARKYIPEFSNGAPSGAPPTGQPTGLYSFAFYDAFGRVLGISDYGPVQTIRKDYHALSEDVWDAADMSEGKHYGTYASTRVDGHGRTIATSESARVTVNGAQTTERHEVRTRYLATGEPELLTRFNVTGTDPPVERWMRYDSLGRMVLNVDPHTSVGYVGPRAASIASLKAWRYAYNDNGDLVGTSDARGCGVNYFYDGVARLIAEDYSPCQADHSTYLPAYSAPDFTTHQGIEVFYQYDQLPASWPLPLPTSYNASTALLSGRLAAVYDRGSLTYMTYDDRGRVITAHKALANPDVLLTNPAVRYQQPWFSKHTAYDSADRIVEESTGASSPELLDGSGNSWVRNTYSERGTLVSVTSSYGELIQGIHRSADGLIEQIDHGDRANTSTIKNYDDRRFLREFRVERAVSPDWSSPPPTYQPPPDPTTQPLVLRYEGITRDVVGNPIAIQDFRTDAEWPAGARPVHRDIQYDNLYRVIQVDYNYTAGSDSWVSPYAPELAGSSDPRRPSDVPSQIVRATRIKQQKFTYDWLGNLSRSSDDLNTLWDRSMGAMRTWTSTSMPYRFRDAGDRADTTWPGSDWADAPTYDETGNIGQIRVTRTATCTSGGTACSHTYTYYYDEIGRLYRALRHEGTPQKAELRFVYDANDDRVIKSDVLAPGTADDKHTLYIFDSLELRRAAHDATNLRYTVNSQTEVPYLNANGVRLGRVVYESPTDGEPRLSGNARHVFLNVGDELGSISIVIDKATGELVERMTYQPYGATESDYRPGRWKGFREDYRFTGKEEDQEVGLTYFGRRFLSAQLGRWVSPDPLAVHSMGSADLNLYAYVRGAVLKAVDPLGLADVSTSLDAGIPPPPTMQSEPVNGVTTITEQIISGKAPQREITKPAIFGTPGQIERGDLIGYGKGAWNSAVDAGELVANYGGPLQLTLPHVDLSSLKFSSVAPDEQSGYLVGAIQSPLLAAAGGALQARAAFGLPKLFGATEAGEGAAALNRATLKCPGCGICFAPGTKVLMADGSIKPIEQIAVGDRVLSDDPLDSEPPNAEEVDELHKTETYRLFHIQVGGISGGEVASTGSHPFWTERGWVNAEDLQAGDLLTDALGAQLEITSIAIESRETPTFNLSVKTHHTYFVVAGTQSILVHNQHQLSFSILDESGHARVVGNVVSQPMSAEEAALGYPRSSLATHTEARLLRTVPVLPGETLNMEGFLPPCTNCRGAMNQLTGSVPGTTANYTWFDDVGKLQTWTSRAGKKICP